MVFDEAPEVAVPVEKHVRVHIVELVLGAATRREVASQVVAALVERHLVAAFGEPQGGGQPGDAAANHDDAGRCATWCGGSHSSWISFPASSAVGE